MVSACGIICNECREFNKRCKGCYVVSGKPFWIDDADGKDICEIYNCCIKKKGLDNCGQCKEIPCDIFYNLKDPALSEEEHIKSIKERVQNFKEDLCMCSSLYCSNHGNCRKCYENHAAKNSLTACLRK